MQIEFISDVSCPWCAIGLHALEAALQRVAADGIRADIRFQPFELNPGMADGGQDVVEHLSAKYRMSPEQVAANTEAIRQRGAELGFEFGRGQRRRIYNTRPAHRLLHWAALQDLAKQRALKHGLFKAYFTEGRDPSDQALLAQLAAEAGLDAAEAAQVLADQRYDDEVGEAERGWYENGIGSVPSLIINGKYLISGGQPVERFERALRQIASEEAAATG